MRVKRILSVAFSLIVLAAAAPLRGEYGSAPKFQIRLYGGLSYLLGGDANDGVSGFFLAEKDSATAYGLPVSLGFSAAHLGMSFGGDFIFQITPNFGIGVGAGYAQVSKESSMIISSTPTITINGKPSFNALPIKLGLFFSFPLGPSIDFNFNVGGGYSNSETGTLYYYEDYFMSTKLYPMIRVASTPPSESWVHNLREAKVNFSGG